MGDVIPLKRRRPAERARVLPTDPLGLPPGFYNPGGLPELEPAHGYADPVAGIAMQADRSARVVHVIVGRGQYPVEITWTPDECRRFAAELKRLACDAEEPR